MPARAALLALMLLLLAAAPAPDERLPAWDQWHTNEGNQTIRTLRAFGNCAVRVRAAAVAALLASGPGSAAESAAVAALVEGENHPCVYQTTRMTFRSRPVLRGIVAEFAYNGGHPDRHGLEPRPFAPGDGAGAGQWPDAPDWNRGRRLAACTVHRDPREVHALIGFNHDSPGETRSLRALRPAMLACLPEGGPLTLSRLAIRAMLAEALFHFARGEPSI